jgi:hypothetical protein
MAPPSPPPSPPPSWVILSTLPIIARLDSPTDVSLAPLEAPPRVTLVKLSPRALPSTTDQFARLKLPYVRAADPSGLLLAVTPPLPTPPPSSSSDDNESDAVDVTDIPRPADYLVLDVSSGTATRVPDLCDDAIVYNWRNLGVIAAPGGAPRFMLAEFHHRVGFDEATLTCFSSQTDKWVGKDVDNPLPCCIWSVDAIISHDAKLWWVDVAEGLLACDPFADAPEMVYVPLPEPEEEDDDDYYHHASRYDYSVDSKGKLRSRRCVQVSNGKFRCVELSRIRRTKRGAPTVIMHTLVDPETAEWTVEYVVFFDEIWDDDTYKASGLPEKDPVIALIHPENPGVLYFFVKDYLVGFDMRARKLVCQAREPTKGAVSPSDVLALVLPPALTAGTVQTARFSDSPIPLM